MMKDYTHSVIRRADELHRLDMAADALPACAPFDFRAGWAAVLAALMLMIPTISAAQILI